MNKQPISYLQFDKRWGSKPYRVKGETSTISSAGCGPTCAAMLIETITGKKFTPEDACKWSMSHGYKALNQGTYYSYFKSQFKAFGIECNQLNAINTYGKPNHENHKKAIKLLEQGYYLIALMNPGLWTSGGHFVVVWWADNKIHINDPASIKEARIKGDPHTFKSQVKYYWWVDARAHNLPTSNKTSGKEGKPVPVYARLGDVPPKYRPSVQKLMQKKVLSGYNDPDPGSLNDNVLNLTEDMCRIFKVLDSLKLLD